jgi:hypothetical protein
VQALAPQVGVHAAGQQGCQLLLQLSPAGQLLQAGRGLQGGAGQ